MANSQSKENANGQQPTANVKRMSKANRPGFKRHPKWDEMCRAYGERACRRAAKLCVETASIGELKFRLEND